MNDKQQNNIVTSISTSNGVNWIGIYTFLRREVERMFRIVIQALVAPLISATLFIFIFGSILGKKIDLIAGVPYMQFVFPGILVMNILASSFDNSSSAMFFQRWIKSIHELLVAPFSYFEMVASFVFSAVVRGLTVGTGVLIIGLFFGAVQISNIPLFILLVVAIAIIFSLLGILVGLWAKGFEQLGLLNIFVITPLSFLGGMFYSIEFLPEAMKTVTLLNPIFYLIDTMRYATLGIHESNLAIGATIIIGLILVLSALVIHLFKIGWKLRE